MGLTQPPKTERPSRAVIRFLFLVLLVLLAGTVIWHYTIQERIRLLERSSVGSLGVDADTLIQVDGAQLRVVEHSTSGPAVVMLHDVDVGGSVVLTDLITAASGEFRVVTVDLPGFGLSTRFAAPGPPHTVGAMASLVAGAIERVMSPPVTLVGVGLGGKVAAEIAATRPALVEGLVLVDVDFWAEDGWRERTQRLPLFGSSATFTFETSGRLSIDTWAPHCREGGWCPGAQQRVDRDAAASLTGSTESINAFYNTPASSNVPSDLDEIVAPTIYVWSLAGPVRRESVERIKRALPEMAIVDVDTWMAHVDAPSTVVDALDRIGG